MTGINLYSGKISIHYNIMNYNVSLPYTHPLQVFLQLQSLPRNCPDCMLQWALQWGTGPSPHPVHSSSSWHPVQLPTATFCGLMCKLGNLCSDNGYCSSQPCSGPQRELPAVLIMMFSLPPPSVRLSVISCSIAHIISATKTHCQPYIRLFLELYQSRQMQSRTCSQPKYISRN